MGCWRGVLCILIGWWLMMLWFGFAGHVMPHAWWSTATICVVGLLPFLGGIWLANWLDQRYG